MTAGGSLMEGGRLRSGIRWRPSPRRGSLACVTNPHFDLKPTGRTRAEEVTRALRLGARQLADHTRPDGRGWVVMADPEGNEFCVERGELG